MESSATSTAAAGKAKLKVIVKRTLRQYGYPPDMQLLATETVLEQARMLADALSDNTSPR